MAFRVESINVPSGGYGGMPSAPNYGRGGGGDALPSDLFYMAMALLNQQQNATMHQNEMKTRRYEADKQFAGLEDERKARTKGQEIQNRLDESLVDIIKEARQAELAMIKLNAEEAQALAPVRRQVAEESAALTLDQIRLSRANMAKFSEIKDQAVASAYFKMASRALNTLNEVSRVELAKDLQTQIRKGQIAMEKLAARFPQIDNMTLSAAADPTLKDAFAKAYSVSIGQRSGQGLSAREIVESIAFKNELSGKGPFGLDYLRQTPGTMAAMAETWTTHRKLKDQQFQDANRSIEGFMPGPRTVVARRQFKTLDRLFEEAIAGDSESLKTVSAIQSQLVAGLKASGQESGFAKGAAAYGYGIPQGTVQATTSQLERFAAMDANQFASFLRGGVLEAEKKVLVNPAFDATMAPHRVGVSLDAAAAAKNAAGIMATKPDTLFYFADVVNSMDVQRRKAAAGDENATRFVQSMEIQFPALKNASLDTLKNAEGFPAFVEEALTSSPSFKETIEQMTRQTAEARGVRSLYSTEALFEYGLDTPLSDATTQPAEGARIPLSELSRLSDPAARRYADLLRTKTDADPFDYVPGQSEMEGMQSAAKLGDSLLGGDAFAPPAEAEAATPVRPGSFAPPASQPGFDRLDFDMPTPAQPQVP